MGAVSERSSRCLVIRGSPALTPRLCDSQEISKNQGIVIEEDDLLSNELELGQGAARFVIEVGLRLLAVA